MTKTHRGEARSIIESSDEGAVAGAGINVDTIPGVLGSFPAQVHGIGLVAVDDGITKMM
jgi:hypothetical protein